MIVEEVEVGSTVFMTSAFSSIEKGDSHNCIGIAYRIVRPGIVEFFLMPYTTRLGRTTLRFPGGRKEGIETPFETLRREWKQEVADNAHRASFDIHIKEKPLLMFPEPDENDSEVIHWKMSFLVNQVEGDIRKGEINDTSGTILGTPRFVEGREAFERFQIQGYSTRFHFLAAIFALRELVSEGGTALAKRYASIIEPFEDLAQEIEQFQDLSPTNTSLFSEVIARHGNLLGIET